MMTKTTLVLALAVLSAAVAVVSAARVPPAAFGGISPSTLAGLFPKDVAQHYGYVNITMPQRPDDTAHIFYWMFESQGNPKTDPVVAWFTGGPGCASELALFFENGPYTVNPDLSLKANPNSWNAHANLLYVDQPIGTGLSWADKPEYLHDEDGVAQEMQLFFKGFLDQYPQFGGQRPWFLTGESYAGHYLPAMAAEVAKRNGPINLKAVAIGNGWVDPLVQYGYYGPFMLANGKIGKTVADAVAAEYAVCKGLLEAHLWPLATVECNVITETIMAAVGGFNVYDITAPCDGPLCYNMTAIEAYMNQPSVRAQLGVPPDLEWSTCDTAVNLHFRVDVVKSFRDDVVTLLEHQIPVWFYNGVNDYICNWMGTQELVRTMPWSGQAQYNQAPTKDWTGPNGGDALGSEQYYQNLHRVTVKNAGHMVPHDQGAAALQLLSHVLSNTPLAP